MVNRKLTSIIVASSIGITTPYAIAQDCISPLDLDSFPTSKIEKLLSDDDEDSNKYKSVDVSDLKKRALKKSLRYKTVLSEDGKVRIVPDYDNKQFATELRYK